RNTDADMQIGIPITIVNEGENRTTLVKVIRDSETDKYSGPTVYMYGYEKRALLLLNFSAEGRLLWERHFPDLFRYCIPASLNTPTEKFDIIERESKLVFLHSTATEAKPKKEGTPDDPFNLSAIQRIQVDSRGYVTTDKHIDPLGEQDWNAQFMYSHMWGDQVYLMWKKGVTIRYLRYQLI
ncbi:MAG: hypothetical protein ACRC3B_17165, partial [Bacteroidia bacterium]